MTCIRYQGGPYQAKVMSPWPRSKTTQSSPFINTGVDYFGLLYVKNVRNRKKVWICLFTCIVVRAVHLEVVEDITAEHFLEAFRRFIARRGKPNKIISDNATTFKAAKNAIDIAWNDILRDHEVHSYLSKNRIEWKFIIELSPWMGGFYQRLVGITKMALKKTIGKFCLTHTQLQTIITEVEAVINSRPLVYVNDDLENQIIMPNHFLSLNTKNGTPELIRNNKDDDKNDPDYQNEELTTAHKLLETWQKGNKYLEQFWKVWKDGYLLNLRERNQLFWKHPRIQAKKCPKIGDIVQIKDLLPRGTWRMGRIVEMIRSSDGEERAARVMMPNRNILQRSIIHLYPIECNDEEPNKENDDNLLNDNNLKGKHDEKTTQEQNKNNEIVKRNRPVRRAAQEARDKIVGQNQIIACGGNVANVREDS